MKTKKRAGSGSQQELCKDSIADIHASVRQTDLIPF